MSDSEIHRQASERQHQLHRANIAKAKAAGVSDRAVAGVSRATGYGIWELKRVQSLHGHPDYFHIIWGSKEFDTYDKSATLGPRGGVKRTRYLYGRPRRRKRI